MSSARLEPRVAAVVALLLLTACDSPITPVNIDPAALTAATAQIQASLEAPVTRSLGVLGAYLFQVRSAGPAAPLLVPGRADGLTLGSRLVARLAAPAAVLSAFPDTLRGKTLEFDCAAGRYSATARSGAPPAAVRFTLYATSSNGGGIACPTVEIGRVDFTDTLAFPGQAGLHVTAADQAGTPYVEYVLSGSTPAVGTTALAVGGTVSDGVTPLAFGLNLSAVNSGTDLTGTADVTLGSSGSSIQVTVHDDIALQNDSGRENIDFGLRAGGESARLVGPNTITSSTSSLDLSLSVNGTPYAIVTGSVMAPSFRGPNGKALAGDALTAAEALYHAPIGIFSDVGGLLNPAEIALGL